MSIATIQRDGPFSDFAGYDRTIVPIEGNGIELIIDGVRTVTLTRPFEPFAFKGEARTECRLIGGPARDFNVMTRRQSFRHSVESTRISEALDLECEGPWTFVVVVRGTLCHARTGDTIALDGCGQVTLSGSSKDCVVCVVRLQQRAQDVLPHEG